MTDHIQTFYTISSAFNNRFWQDFLGYQYAMFGKTAEFAKYLFESTHDSERQQNDAPKEKLGSITTMIIRR